MTNEQRRRFFIAGFVAGANNVAYAAAVEQAKHNEFDATRIFLNGWTNGRNARDGAFTKAREAWPSED